MTALLDLYSKPGPQLAALVKSIFQVESVAIFDADLHETYEAGQPFPDLENLIQNVFLFETVSDDLSTGMSRRVLRVGNLPVGALLLRGETSPLVANAIACLIAITFDRYHALANESRTEAARRAEQLRTTVLDSLAHAYKTPLTAIRAASTGLGEMGNLTPAQSVLVALIEDQSALLNQLTTRLLKTARLETHDLAIQPEEVSISSVIDDVVSSMREQLMNVSVKVVVPKEDCFILCDRDLLATLLCQ
jgi:two-component system sensor histidine kinase KdpD